MIDLWRALAALLEPPGPEVDRLAGVLGLSRAPEAWEHTEFLSEQLYPYASVYLDESGQMGGAARELIAGIWRTLHQPVPVEADHLGALLGLYASLAEWQRDAEHAEEAEAWRRARVGLLWEHLYSWLPRWLDRASDLAPGVYREWAALVADALRAEVDAADLPPQLPLHLADARPLQAPHHDPEDFLGALLAPVRCGMIVTGVDLRRCAIDCELGARRGERAYLLRSLLQQDAPAVLGWLAQRARVASQQVDRDDAVARFWAERAGASADVLEGAVLDLAETG